LEKAPGRLGLMAQEFLFMGTNLDITLKKLLQFSRLDRAEIFGTNSVLCNPKDDSGNNSTPTQNEIKNCSAFLLQQIQLINPKIIVTLGASPLLALKYISDHNLVLTGGRKDSAKMVWKDSNSLIPSGTKSNDKQKLCKPEIRLSVCHRSAKTFLKKRKK
jgi:uracil-DNA glycosylase